MRFPCTTIGLLGLLTLTSTALAAPALKVTLSDNPTTCQTTRISFDSSTGSAPFTLTIAPLGHVPISVSLPSNYMSSQTWSYDWTVPGYTNAVSSVIIAVSDSTGSITGTSSLTHLTKSGSCSAPPEHLDFVWYPPSTAPRQCQDWLLTVQEDRGNLGLKMPVDLLILPENDTPTRLRITDAKRSSVDWTVNYARGTRFAVAAFDAGTSGTGGVGGEVYTVGSGREAACVGQAQRDAVQGLPAASSTAAVRQASATTSHSRMATSRVAVTATASGAKSTATAAAKEDAEDGKSGVSAGVIGGAVGGVLGAVAVIGLVIFLCRRKRKGPDEYGVYPSNEKRGFFGGLGSGRSSDRSAFSGRDGQGGRFGASTDQQGAISPFVTGRASPWRWSSRNGVGLFDSQDSAQMSEDRRAIVSRMNDGPRSMGHSSSVSLHRGRDSFGGGSGVNLASATSVHSVVPDEALFPPPPPMPRNQNMMGGIGAGLGAGVGAMGMKQNWNRDRSDSGSSYQPPQQQQRDPFRNPAVTHERNLVPTQTPYRPQAHQPLPPPPSQQGAQQAQQHPASRHSTLAISGLPLSPSSTYTRSRDSEQDLSTMRIPAPAPISTSLFDPYAHASRLYSDTERDYLHAALNERANAATPTSITSNNSAPRYADPKESAARFRRMETQLLDERKKVVSNVYDDDSEDDEGGLPYMS